jgi:hypothetical protein
MSAARTGSGAGFWGFRDWFALDTRSLALLRVALGVLLLLDWIDRLPDLRTHYSDEGIIPREILTGVLPISVHLFHGSAWFQGLLARQDRGVR